MSFFQDPFLLFMDEINEKMGTLDGIQIRAEAKVHEYFYNNVQVCPFSQIIVNSYQINEFQN